MKFAKLLGVLFAIVYATTLPAHAAGSKTKSFRPGQSWLDVDGLPIESHLGGVLYERGTYYWYGMNLRGATIKPYTYPAQHFSWMLNAGMSCYSSKDLYHWKLRSISALPITGDPNHPMRPENWMIRPKVLKCPSTGQYVMMAQLVSMDFSTLNCIVVATSKRVDGPFTYKGVLNPPGGAYDITLYQDDDGKAYLITAHEWVKAHQLAPDYLSIVKSTELTGVAGEAPAIFKYGGTYYFLTSNLTGWAANANKYSVSQSLLGPYQPKGTFCTGPGAENSFAGQTTFVLPVAGKPGSFIWMADRMNAVNDGLINDLGKSTHIWLPISLDAVKQSFEVGWRDEWDLTTLQK